MFSLVGYIDTFNTLRLYKLQGSLQTDVLSGNHKTKSAVLFRLLTHTKEAPKKDCQSYKHIERKSGKGW